MHSGITPIMKIGIRIFPKEERTFRPVHNFHAVQSRSRRTKNLLKMSLREILAVVFAFLLPPIGVLLQQDGITKDFWINLLLTMLAVFPGILHALWIICKE
ncbi:hypothetical protein BV898_12916 [Hypsibius exemplaris]|uniref:Plasma membrane proteolipid 3 n=1 Tax=Hypsibius exemplaris TaxID=2072580 RepID=A0A1W0WC58_HYPEX|nr:hypothetical protein BV898_12916 [Hypsibius exemplaris]